MGSEATVLGLKDEWTASDCLADEVPFSAEAVVGPRSIGFSPSLKARLEGVASSNAVFHCHGLWMYPGWAARQCAGKARRPFVVSPHGMLEPWALNNARWKKKLAGFLFENQNLASAQCLHALCPAEAANFRRLGLRNPVAIIPNGIDLETVPAQPADSLVNRFPALKDRRRVLFLSRIHPKKGLDNLLLAWRKVAADFKDWQLLIAGSGDPAYERALKSAAADLIEKQSVIFLGPLYGQEKAAAFALASVFVLPSFSEGFSMAILEAAAAGVPVLLTPECNFPELVRAGAAVEVTANAAAIEGGIRDLLNFPGTKLADMGGCGRNLVKTAYTWPEVARQMGRVYKWLADKGPQPETVQCV
jgi:poly(glycerol-phosphate) alpha-glucosyltransferase